MATGTFYLRPSADISVGHVMYPSGSAAAYLLINEEVSDEDATYIRSPDTQTGVSTSKFKLSNTSQLPGKRFVVNSVNIAGDTYTSYLNGTNKNEFILEIDGTETALVATTTNKTFDISVTDAITLINEAVAQNGILPDINITVISYDSLYIDGTKERNVASGVSQVYVAINYEEILDIGVHKKVNGEWVAATAAYQKQSGAWVEITEDECKAILQSHPIVTKN